MQVSVIVPSYNVYDFVMETILSVQQQTISDWEMIIIDDGSTDCTVDVIRGAVENDARIRLIEQRHQGVAAARNRGIREARGRYISFLDSDDLWKKNYLEQMLGKANNSEMVCCGFERLINGHIYKIDNIYPNDNEVMIAYAKKTFRTHICCVLLEKEALIKNSLYFTEGIVCGEDEEFLYKTMCVLDVKVVPEVLMIYRRRSDSATNSSSLDPYFSLSKVKAYEGILTFLQQKMFFVSEEVLQGVKEQLECDRADYIYKLFKSGHVKSAVGYLSIWEDSVKTAIVCRQTRKSRRLKFKLILCAYKIFGWLK